MSDDIHLAEDARRYRRRLKKQRTYTATWRATLEGDNLPERDEIAAACLRVVIRGVARDPESWLPFLTTIVVKELARARPELDFEGTKARINEMIVRDLKRQDRANADRSGRT